MALSLGSMGQKKEDVEDDGEDIERHDTDAQIVSGYGTWAVRQLGEAMLAIETDKLDAPYVLPGQLAEVRELLESIDEAYEDLPAEGDMMIEQVLTDFAEDNGVSTPTVQNVLESDTELEGGCGVKGDRERRVDRSCNLRLMALEGVSLQNRIFRLELKVKPGVNLDSMLATALRTATDSGDDRVVAVEKQKGLALGVYIAAPSLAKALRVLAKAAPIKGMYRAQMKNSTDDADVESLPKSRTLWRESADASLNNLLSEAATDKAIVKAIKARGDDDNDRMTVARKLKGKANAVVKTTGGAEQHQRYSGVA